MIPTKYLATIAASSLLMLAACGGGGSGTRPQTTPQATAPPPVVERDSKLVETLLATGGPLAPQGSARQAPVVYLDANEAYWKSNPSHWNRRALDGRWHVGGDVSPVTDHPLPTIRHHDATAVSYGEITDGVGKDKVVRYLEQMSTGWWGEYDTGLYTLDAPPVVRLAEGMSHEYRDYIIRAVRIINSALPHGWKMHISNVRFPAGERDRWEYLLKHRLGRAEIFVELGIMRHEGSAEYSTFADWIRNYPQNTGGHIWIDPIKWGDVVNRVQQNTKSDREQAILAVLIHEILHGFGAAHHEMGKSNQGPEAVFGTPGHVLYALDREALLAAYSRLEPGTRPEDIDENLGPWSDTSLHVKGVLEVPDGEVAFGAAHRNRFVSPWANGPIPSAYLAGNAALSGGAHWSGRLLGFTPNAEAVVGAAGLTVRLETLDGDLDFTGLESWSPNAAPGAVGTGKRWQSGSLHYDIGVRGNTFIQTGGDTGTVTGVFFGRLHEGMGGVLERPDLSAGFGGKRGPVEPVTVLSEVGSFVQYYGPSWDEWIDPYSRWIPPPDFRSFLDPTQHQEWDAAAADCTAEVQICIDTFGGPNVDSAIARWKAAIAEWEEAATEVWLTHKRAREAYRFFDGWGFEAAIGDKMLFSAVIDGTMHDGCSTLPPWVAAVAECAPTLGFDITIEGTPTGGNPTIGSVVWSGDARGVDSRGYPIEEARVRLEADLQAATVDARLSHFERHIFSWRGLALTNGTFSQGEAFKHYQDGGAAEAAPREWSINGAFYGNDHQGAAGMWTEPSGAFGVFGALRQQSEPVAKLEPEDWGYWATLDGDTLFRAALSEWMADCIGGPCQGWAATVRGDKRGVNPTIGSATWTGHALAGSIGWDRLKEGRARLEADLSAATIDVNLTELGKASHSWTGLSMSDGAFSGDDGLASVEGAFYGAEHQGAAGSFEMDLGARGTAVGVFGVLREPR